MWPFKKRTREEELLKKAKLISEMVLALGNECSIELEKDLIKESVITEEELLKGKNMMIRVYTDVLFSYYIQKFFWESVIQDDNTAQLFDKMIAQQLGEIVGESYVIISRVFRESIKKDGEDSAMQFTSRYIARELGCNNAIVTHMIVVHLGSALKYLFPPAYKACLAIWNHTA